MKTNKPEDKENKNLDEDTSVLFDYGIEVGRITKVDLSSNNLLEVIASAAKRAY